MLIKCASIGSKSHGCHRLEIRNCYLFVAVFAHHKIVSKSERVDDGASELNKSGLFWQLELSQTQMLYFHMKSN